VGRSRGVSDGLQQVGRARSQALHRAARPTVLIVGLGESCLAFRIRATTPKFMSDIRRVWPFWRPSVLGIADTMDLRQEWDPRGAQSFKRMLDCVVADAALVDEREALRYPILGRGPPCDHLARPLTPCRCALRRLIHSLGAKWCSEANTPKLHQQNPHTGRASRAFHASHEQVSIHDYQDV